MKRSSPTSEEIAAQALTYGLRYVRGDMRHVLEHWLRALGTEPSGPFPYEHHVRMADLYAEIVDFRRTLVRMLPGVKPQRGSPRERFHHLYDKLTLTLEALKKYAKTPKGTAGAETWRLEKKLAVAVAALKQYGNDRNWELVEDLEGSGYYLGGWIPPQDDPVDRDGPGIANEALEEIERGPVSSDGPPKGEP